MHKRVLQDIAGKMLRLSLSTTDAHTHTRTHARTHLHLHILGVLGWVARIQSQQRSCCTHIMSHTLGVCMNVSGIELYGVRSKCEKWSDAGLQDHPPTLLPVEVDMPQACTQHWVVLDGPMGQEWVEHLNSVLDSSNVFCLRSGERLELPKPGFLNIIFETSDLTAASPSTVSRCGILYFGATNDAGARAILGVVHAFFHY